MLSVNNKEKDFGNHANQTAPSAPKSVPDILKGRQVGGVKDASGQANGDGLLLHQANEVYPSNRKLHGKDAETMPQQPHQRLQSTNGKEDKYL